jgi:protein-S-isoprenylcysteine O-methyltransferase Ste14
MTDILAIVTIMFSALVPLFWIPVHCLSPYVKKLGVFTYITPFVTWLPIAWLFYSYRALILRYTVEVPWTLRGLGVVMFIMGMLLQLWTLRLLGAPGIMGLPEVTPLVESIIITTGPFSVIRHPTYASHTIMYTGMFLITGVIAVGVITLLDLLIINTVVIPLEDRELVERFGDEYRKYKKKVPAFIPRLARK